MKTKDNPVTPVQPQSRAGVSMQSDLQQKAQAAYDEGVALRRQERFGEAMNAFARSAELSEEAGLAALRDSALASIELIREINGFVNTDLMNP